MTLHDLYFMKNVCLNNVDILEKFFKKRVLNKKIIAVKDDFEILRWSFVTFNDLWGHTLFHRKLSSS